MKNSFLIPVVFIANLAVWACSLSFFSVLGVWRYLDAVSSGNISLFAVMCAFRALYILPLGLMLALTVTFFFLMRHRSVPFVSIPLVLALVGGSVIFLIPWSYRAEASLASRFPDAIRTWGAESPAMFDTGFIRADPARPGLLWVDLAESDGSARRFLSANTGALDGILSFTGDALYDPASRSLVSSAGIPLVTAGGDDPLFSASLRYPPFARPLFRDAALVLDSLKAAYGLSLIRYLTVAGCFFAAMTSLWCLCRASGWRMLNAFLTLAAARALLFLWPLADGGSLSRLASRFLPPSVSADLTLPGAYLAVAALVLVASVVVFARRRLRHVDSGAFYG